MVLLLALMTGLAHGLLVSYVTLKLSQTESNTDKVWSPLAGAAGVH